ncbi:MAG TPA: T9SS type A sorting domain-containing protein [Rubricoccaceae bacterium]|nr:T9SS type A sorting domain-containing protein [Rubricoccaceae bacterium]
MTLRTALAAGLLLAAPLASAQKPAERSPLEVGQDYVEVTSRAGSDLLVAADGTPRAIYHPNYAVRPAEPEAMARQYLAENAALLRLDPTLDDLALRAVREGLAGTTVRFTQTVRGVPVYGPDLVVSIDRQHRVQFVLSPYRPGLTLPAARPAVTDAEARALVGEHLDAQAPFQLDETSLVVYPMPDGARLAWLVRLVPTSPIGDWEALVDAADGTFLRVADRAINERGEDPPAIPAVAALAYPRAVNGTGYVFYPDPLTRAGVPYGTPGYTDNGDADSPELTAARSFVRLRDITFDGTNHHLDNPYASIRDFEGPFLGTFEQPSADFDFTRSEAGFEAVNTFWHIDRAMRFINERLGLDVMPHQYTGGVQFDPHGLNGADNSHYVSSTGRVAFGEGCVDDAEDADVVVHELGHGLHDWVTVGGLSQVQGLSEGTGDYFAASYTRHTGLLDPSDPSYYWVFKWDGHNPCWPGRVTNYPAHYPEGLTGSIHTDGQMWSSTLMAIWSDIGGKRTDGAVLEGLAMTNGSTNQEQAAQAVLQAARNLGFPEGKIQAMFDRFSARGYDVTIPPAAAPAAVAAAETPVSFDLTEAYPNPFRSSAAFTLSVAEAQHVEVALYDALGRRVQTLFEGAMDAGERRVVAIDARDLPSGLYVYRAVGEGVVASQTVVLSR